MASQVQECLLLGGGELAFTDEGSSQAGRASGGMSARYQFSTRQLQKALGTCRKSIPGMPARAHGVGTTVALSVESTESPPAWSDTDRLRLRYMLTRELNQLVIAENRLGGGSAPASQAGAQLIARIEFGGSKFLQRTLDQWVQPARRLVIRFSLESMAGETLAERAVRVKLSPTLRQVDDGNSTSPWFSRTLSESSTAVRQLLDELARVEALYPVTRASDGRLAINLSGVRDKTAPIQVLLIPLAGDSFDAQWQTATADPAATPQASLDEVSLKVSDGDTRRCAEQACVAWPLP